MRVRLKFANGKESVTNSMYFPGLPACIEAHGGEGRSYIGEPGLRRSMRRVPDEDGVAVYEEIVAEDIPS